MHLNINRTELAEALAAIRAGADPKHAMPILANVAITAHEKSVTLTTTNLDLTLRARVAAGVATRGETSVGAQLLHDIVKALKGDTVELELTKNTLRVVCGSSKFNLATIDPADMPPVPAVKDPVRFDLKENVLRNLLGCTRFAQATDTAKPVLAGVSLQLNGNVKATACDGRRLAIDTVDSNGKKKVGITLPAGTVDALLRLLNPNEEMAKPVEVTAARNVAQFNFGDYSVVTRLLEGNYPDVSQIIPDLKGEGVTIGRHLLLDACRRVALVGDGCRLEFRKTNLTIMSRSERNDAPGEAVESLLVANTKDVTVSVGARYLIEALAAIDSPEVSILAEKDTPLMLKAPGKPWLTVISTLKEVPAAAKAPAKK